MKERTRKIFIMIVMAALIVSLMAASFAALTYGRYSGGRRDENSAYEDILDLVGETAFEVSTADELVNAINNGYSYIKVVGDDPTLVVNNDVADVIVNLVLDVNGHKIVRNSRNPLLNVRQSVSVVLVYDSSEKAEGGFYNPVGSALQTSGGTLTVGEGVYESGPSSEATQSQGEGTVSATVCSRDNNRKATSYSVQSTAQTFPKLTKKTGDVYLTADTSNSYLKADTYLIYTEEENAFVEDGTSAGDGTVLDKEQLYVNAKKDDNGTVTSADKFSPICNVASCDFYYYYPVNDTPGTVDSPQTYAVVYGYNEVKGLAKTKNENLTSGNETNLVWPYAAIRSEAGNTHARGGEFYTYFGEENTYSIYSEGGTMTVGLSGESDPPKFQAIGKGVCINMAGTSGSADQTLTIENGEFSSKIGDTIKMSGGEMEVKKGSFTKDATGADENSTNNGSAISISGGTLNMAGSEKDGAKSVSFTVTGNYVNGIRVQATTAAATATIKHAIFNFNEGGGSTNVAGIRSFGGDLTVNNTEFNISKGAASGEIKQAAGLSAEGGTVTAESCKFNFAQDASNVSPIESAGIYSSGGQVTATGCDFAIPGNNNYGIYSSIKEAGAGEGYDTTAKDCTFTMKGNQNHGIYAAGGKTLASGGTYTIGSENGSGQTANFGIQVSSGSVALAGVTLDVYGEKSSCVYAVGGTISLSGENAVNMHFSSTGTTISSTAISTEGGAIEVTGGSTSVSSNALGITARQNDGNEGSISIANGAAVTVGAENSPLHVTGVYVNGGKIENKGTLTVFSTIDDRFSWNESNKYNGVYVNGGSLVSNGTLNVTFTGVQNAAFNNETQEGKVNTSYLNQQIKSYAVRVDNGNATIVSGGITNEVGGGVLVNGGTVDLGAENAANADLTVSTSGSNSDGKDHFVTTDKQWQYDWTLTGGHAVAVEGGTLNINSGTYTAKMGNGILVRNLATGSTQNTVTIKNGIFEGYSGSDDRRVGPGAFYALKVMGGPLTLNINGGTFGKALGNNGVTPDTNGGAFVMGNPESKQYSTVTVTNGSFNSYNSDTFAIFRYVVATFEEKSDTDDISMTVTKASTDSNNYAAIGVQNDFVYNNNDDHPDRGSDITIKNGTYSGGFGIWYGSSVDKVNISGGTITGSSDGILYSVNGTVENSLTISGGTITGTNGSGLNLAGALYAMHAVVITGGTFVGGQYGAYYGKDGGDDGVYINDGLLIMGGTFTGTPSAGVGFFFGVNPWSQKVEGFWPIQEKTPYNNVAIVGGTFSSFGANDDDIKAGDVFTMHDEYNGVRQYGVDKVNGVYGNAGAGGGDPVKDLNAEIVLSTEQYT